MVKMHLANLRDEDPDFGDERYTCLFDPARGGYYFFDKLTGEFTDVESNN